jgi:hypothetical protein
MIYTKKVIDEIDAAYGDDAPYNVLCLRHTKIIADLIDEWEKVSDRLPRDNQPVFAIQDLSQTGHGRCKFVGVYYYRENIGFVANKDDDDAYGFITHWCPADETDEYKVTSREFTDDDDRMFTISHGKYDTEDGDTWILGIDSTVESISITIKDLDKLIDALKELNPAKL